jgi:hypothetical protein
MDMERIKPSTMSILCAILYSPPPHLFCLLTGTFWRQLLQHKYNCDTLSTKGTEESYRRELQIQKLHTNIWQNSNNKKQWQQRIKAIKENNITHESVVAATVSMEIHTLIFRWDIPVVLQYTWVYKNT